MTAVRPAAALLAIYLAVVLQSTVFSRLPLPGGTPSVVLLVVIALGLAAGTSAGLLGGFAAGLSVDLLSDHPVGVLVLAFTVGGFLAGLLHDETGDRPALRSMTLVAVIVAVVQLLYLAMLGLLGAAGGAVGAGLAASVGYNLLLTPFVLPVVVAAERRLRSTR